MLGEPTWHSSVDTTGNTSLAERTRLCDVNKHDLVISEVEHRQTVLEKEQLMVSKVLLNHCLCLCSKKHCMFRGLVASGRTVQSLRSVVHVGETVCHEEAPLPS